MRIRMSCLAVVAMLSTFAACGSDPKAPTTVAPAGFIVASDAKTGFAVAVPSDWPRIPMVEDLDVFNENANRIRGEFPQLASAIVQARELAQKGVGKLVAVRPDGLAKLNLTVDKAKEKKLDEIAETSIKALTEAGATGMTATRPQVAGRPAVRLSFRVGVRMDEGTVELDEVLYIVQRNREAFFLTVIGADPALADTISSSFRIR